ncbi:hypothetical protein CCAX7_40080 [Capsulimonas corticalis]|uniref:Uncharacterized protein n=1 Tax=Capsulimonas corticalis TaxID=2219043 RepID=A0A402D4Y0_9BACT|nr:FtsX-like permease family protein [Capsulimonas corticalis]BDI31957.1 hypothetical protein CCAX7_40080 [Capsulimonas corticalis]
MMIRRRAARKAPRLLTLLGSLLFLLSSIAAVSGQTGSDKVQVDPEAKRNYRSLSDSVQPARLAASVSDLSGIHYAMPAAPGGPALVANSRAAGTPGADQARDYVLAQFRTILGAGNVHQEDFAVTAPVDNGASITAGGRSYGLRALWPNLVRTSTLPKDGVTGPLIYAARGDLAAFRGQQVEGSVVLMDFNCGAAWMNAARLGAKAIIFVEPAATMRGESEAKFIGIPVSIPRFWVSHADAAALQSAALTTPNFTVTVYADNPWETRSASNIVGVLPGSDPVLSKQIVVIESYYDSMSVVPSLAPGADTACGVAAQIELARLFKANPPKRTVWFVSCGAHFLGIQGARAYVDRHLDEWRQPSNWDRAKHWLTGGRSPIPANRSEVLLFSGLDLTSQTNSFAGFYKGYFYDFTEGDVQSGYSDIGRALRENAEKIAQVLGLNAQSAYGDGINPIGGKGWRNFLPGHFAFDAEAAAMAGGKGITFATTDDARQHSDTPFDRMADVNLANLTQQTKFLACEYWHLLNDTNDQDAVTPGSTRGLMPVTEWPAWTRQGLRLGFCQVKGRVLIFDPKQNFVPDTPVADSLAVAANPSKTMVGVRGNLIQSTFTPPGASKPGSNYNFYGLPLVTSAGTGLRFAPAMTMRFGAYHVHTTDDAQGSRGDIDFAPDQGLNGTSNYPIEFNLTSDSKDTQIIVFPCVATTIYDLLDLSSLISLSGVRVFDGATNNEPRQYGFTLAGTEPGVSYVEDVAVLFSAQGSDTRLKVVMDSGPGAVRFLLINALPPDPKLSNAENQKRAQGLGYAVQGGASGGGDNIVHNGAITNTALRVAQDMWNLDEYRISQLAKYRITNDLLSNPKHTGLHDLAKVYMDQAQAAYAQRDYEMFDAKSRQAWAFEAKVYPQAQATANDVVQGVIFYLFLLIPFAYFLERLLIASHDLKMQLVWSFGIFALIFFIFSKIHPAFDITINPIIVLIAFVMLALSVIVSLLVWGKFEEQIKAMRQTVSGVHKVDVGKGSIAFAAFALGISNMRRRKERTMLTCITLILLTFTVLSFTSVVNYNRPNDVPAPGVSPYNGILLRMPAWDALQDPAYRLLNDEYGRKYPVAPRAWFFGTTQGQQSFLNVSRAQSPVDLKGVIGMAPAEARVSHIDTALALGPDGKPMGRWFDSTDSYSIILPKPIADTLGVTAADVGKITVNFSGVPYLVIGVIDPAKFSALKDLDNETLTPVDFQDAHNQSNSASASTSSFQDYSHIDPATVIIVPYATLINLGGDLRSVAINFGDAATVNQQLVSLMPRLDLNLYAGEDGHNHRFSIRSATKSEGLATIIIPILIASLIVLNTMLGSVFERVKEIKTFSAIGLSPSNIGMLFIAEAMVYAIIGAVSGYLIGQGLSKVISTFNILPGLSLNFSSTSAEIAIGVVIAVVMLSTIFPARKASQVATPSTDRTWKLPDPDGDVWKIALPFAVTGDQARGINGFLSEWFKEYEQQSVGDFLTHGISTTTYDSEYGLAYRLSCRIWLAPFDLGVSQDISLDTIPTDLEDIFDVRLTITRQSGEVANWMRVNRRFVNVVRRQFLIWRTLSEVQRQRYLNPEVELVRTPSESAAVAPAI